MSTPANIASTAIPAIMDVDLIDAGISASDRANRLKASGVCPWSGCKCRRAQRCTMSATDACNNLVRRRVKNCGTCANAGACDDLFVCFMDVMDAEAEAATASPRRRH